MRELAVGDEGPTIRVDDLSRPDFVRYAGASGDFNPIHYDEPHATSAGNKSVFGQGMLTAGILSNVLTEWFDIGCITRFETRFTGQVWPGDSVIATGEVVAVSEDPPSGYELSLTAETDDGRTVITGSATVEQTD
ncbi:MaoC/PaaZ C-terminal domain-containing protein [Haladaptatus sp. ZSTT2]|uniref:MaoC/PaaZ C-terminal domain-containing protein n=1 Tax=Haladaptatus sp. ZSTT2 TaxID=3120515 RepID=UPI00300F47B6